MMSRFFTLIVVWLAAACATVAGELRIGIIGCDTSHCIAFTQEINDATDKNHVAGGKVVAAFKGGSPDIKESASRVEGFASQLQEKYGVKLVDSVEELCREVDAVLLESVDGRPHLEQVRPVFKAGKPVFIDKPVAASLRDVLEINRLARESQTPWFSSSAYRFYESMIEVKNTDVGEVRGAISYGPSHLEAHHPDFFWYGIHPIEALYTVMGTGCISVVRTAAADTDVVTGVWPEGRVGIFRGLRNAATPHSVIVFGTKKVVEQKSTGDYGPLVGEIMKFFQTGVAPVSNKETIEIYTFMEAADESKREGGRPVMLNEVLKKNGGL
jgi:predicted dehydrogenase